MRAVLVPGLVDGAVVQVHEARLAQLADNGPVRGTMVIRPVGYAIWERMQAEITANARACRVR